MFLKTGDKVRVISGKDKGKDGKVVKTIAAKNRVVVEGINKIKKHQKASQDNPQGGIADVDAPIDASNVMLIDPSTNEPTKVSFEVKDGKKVRISKKSNKPID
ncbi:50S ribosomal protein L24 [Fructilactobacillus fructivorans]|uniref:Large ribosomal subunit protein uL24 n=1 Tax=Fructilactobacillus fructivorans TaxID=1614 RepID=A0A0C1LXE2_9LACO|nr:50S ribosomal protein L24 [Fructilactobacillus fructivorans]KID41385.1 LSU ribosomal protein L24p (L26e) [Fructilactobacillus fructivorans]KRK57105.1 50S ribosomal protein L24 [Fructilactobacillus fructivorans]KRN40348.1 50S ribosomal protein L24 [Fructilactobacillus fructivorans]KRN42656.1 50S ribosomal protein L24 [Fructilactobacillus fructivorans]MCT0151728.1 50S ribosomal protein L24 [Fructilactobacillus fructivorans]